MTALIRAAGAETRGDHDSAQYLREVAKMEITTFQIRDEQGATLSGEIEWGETVDVVRYHHPMTGALTENPLQGWADPPGAETGHAATARMIEAVEAADEFCADHVGYDHVAWRVTDDGRLRMIGHV